MKGMTKEAIEPPRKAPISSATITPVGSTNLAAPDRHRGRRIDRSIGLDDEFLCPLPNCPVQSPPFTMDEVDERIVKAVLKKR